MTQISDRFSVKWLDNSYVQRCLDLRKNNRSDVGGASFENDAFAAHLLNNQYLSIKPSWCYRAYGVVDVETDELHSYLLLKMLSSHRAWLLRLVVSNQNFNNGLPLNGLGRALDAALEYAESLEYYQYFTVTPLNRVAAHDRVWNAASIKRRGRYTTYLEEVIPPGVVPSYPFYWDDCLGRAVLSYEGAIRRVMLLPEYRTFKHATILD